MEAAISYENTKGGDKNVGEEGSWENMMIQMVPTSFTGKWSFPKSKMVKFVFKNCRWCCW